MSRSRSFASAGRKCGSQMRVWCPGCSCDYSITPNLSRTNESQGEKGGEDAGGKKKVDEDDGIDPDAAAALRLMQRFLPPHPDATPADLFTPGFCERAPPNVCRLIRRSDPNEILILTDGACLSNGVEPPQGGCAFVFRPSTYDDDGFASFNLEVKGPTGESHVPTSNRAELRAVIGAIGFRAWTGEGIERLMIATDSEYVVKGATERLRKWLGNGWQTSKGALVKNRDLWEKLLSEVAKHQQWRRTLEVKFWLIPRHLNDQADSAAKDAAASSQVCTNCTQTIAASLRDFEQHGNGFKPAPRGS